MKAVDPALAHAQSGDASLTSDKPLTDEEDFELDETTKTAGHIMGNIKNAKDLQLVDAKSETTWPRDRVHGHEVVHNGVSQYSNGVVIVNGNSKVNGAPEYGGKVVENGHESSKTNGGLESEGKVVENGHDRRVQVNGNSKTNGGLESKVVENGHGTRMQVNGNSKVNGGLVSVEKVVANGHENLKINGGLESEGKVVVNGHDRRVQVNGSSKMNGGLECGDKVLENGHGARVHVNGGGLECGDKVLQVNGNSKVTAAGDKDKSVERAESPIATWDRTVAEMKEHAFARLQDELKKAHQELKLRDEEVTRLSRIRQDVEAELEDLTASLFQEAHNMVREANVKQAAAERAHKESQMQVDVLVAEVSALKTLVLTSTPSRPNPHLHPQIDLRGNRTKDDSSLGATSLFNKKHRRSPSHFNLKYGRENSPPDSPVKETQPLPIDPLNCKEGWEVDPDVHREFTAWKLNPKLDKSDPFISRIYNEEINLCLDFPNKELSAHVRAAVESGNIFIEAVSDKSKTVFPKKCALLDVPRQCHYRMKFGDQEQWYCMSQICRNRIIAVCDFLNYLKYIERGLVKSSAHDVYWEVTRLRKDMVLARLGLALLS